jgi:hypothetical protein
VPPKSVLSKVKQASATTTADKPRLPAVRAVASTEFFVLTPAMST